MRVGGGLERGWRNDSLCAIEFVLAGDGLVARVCAEERGAGGARGDDDAGDEEERGGGGFEKGVEERGRESEEGEED